MSERRDPLRSLFREAGEFGQIRAEADDAARITQRGMRAQRRRMAAVAVGVCLVVGGGGAAAVGLLPVRPQPVAPATDPTPSYPSSVPSERLPADPPSPSTTLPNDTSSGEAGSSGAEDPTGLPTRTATSRTTTPQSPPSDTAPATVRTSATTSATTDGSGPVP
ncbi:hypothetical protein F610DRAFT_02892 [Streptomyces sp. LaPpAH-199]|uniref:hypothetical protein n=1 Tax=Streptomyces TaxID=1883 RepID=UPI00088D5B7B|nr:hypothetical protein [Streptomyces sp. LaPpAH-199]MYW80470.1 hypothetical protein [Streptomyces sp. SID8369]SDC86600.1 hypothetical protein F610DRAFT_02892 [Streptomyces sp. LaPpAH-199]